MTRPSVDWEDAYRRGTTLDPTGTYDMLDGMDASSLRLMVQDMLRARSMDELEVMREKWSCNEIALNSALRAEATTKQLFQSLSTLRAEKERHDAALEEKDNHLSKVQKELSAVKEAYRAGKNALVETIQALLRYQQEVLPGFEPPSVAPLIKKDVGDKTGSVLLFEVEQLMRGITHHLNLVQSLIDSKVEAMAVIRARLDMEVASLRSEVTDYRGVIKEKTDYITTVESERDALDAELNTLNAQLENEVLQTKAFVEDVERRVSEEHEAVRGERKARQSLENTHAETRNELSAVHTQLDNERTARAKLAAALREERSARAVIENRFKKFQLHVRNCTRHAPHSNAHPEGDSAPESHGNQNKQTPRKRSSGAESDSGSSNVDHCENEVDSVGNGEETLEDRCACGISFGGLLESGEECPATSLVLEAENNRICRENASLKQKNQELLAENRDLRRCLHVIAPGSCPLPRSEVDRAAAVSTSSSSRTLPYSQQRTPSPPLRRPRVSFEKSTTTATKSPHGTSNTDLTDGSVSLVDPEYGEEQLTRKILSHNLRRAGFWQGQSVAEGSGHTGRSRRGDSESDSEEVQDRVRGSWERGWARQKFVSATVGRERGHEWVADSEEWKSTKQAQTGSRRPPNPPEKSYFDGYGGISDARAYYQQEKYRVDDVEGTDSWIRWLDGVRDAVDVVDVASDVPNSTKNKTLADSYTSVDAEYSSGQEASFDRRSTQPMSHPPTSAQVPQQPRSVASAFDSSGQEAYFDRRPPHPTPRPFSSTQTPPFRSVASPFDTAKGRFVYAYGTSADAPKSSNATRHSEDDYELGGLDELMRGSPHRQAKRFTSATQSTGAHDFNGTSVVDRHRGQGHGTESGISHIDAAKEVRRLRRVLQADAMRVVASQDAPQSETPASVATRSTVGIDQDHQANTLKHVTAAVGRVSADSAGYSHLLESTGDLLSSEFEAATTAEVSPGTATVAPELRRSLDDDSRDQGLPAPHSPPSLPLSAAHQRVRFSHDSQMSSRGSQSGTDRAASFKDHGYYSHADDVANRSLPSRSHSASSEDDDEADVDTLERLTAACSDGWTSSSKPSPTR